MKKICLFLLFSLTLIIAENAAFAQEEKPQLLLRVDDIGMNHAVNMALEDLCQSGIPFSASVMFACPWYQEAVTILKQHPQVAVGVHLTLTSEWRYYKWGPILGQTAVPSLVDSLGYFTENERQFLNNNYKLAEVEKELTAQIERALGSGLAITYLDPHMGVALINPELKKLTEKLAKKYNLGISSLSRETTYYEEDYKDMWAIPVASKKKEFLEYLNDLNPEKPNLVILHIARANPEMDVLEMNSLLEKQNGEAMVSKHRQTELDMLLSPEFQSMIDKKFELINYADLMKK